MTHDDAVGDGSAANGSPRDALDSTLLSPAVCSVSSFTLAVVALLGQNAVSIGTGAVLESRLDGGTEAFYLSWGLALLLQVGLVWLLARRSLVVPGGWEPVLGRAAMVLSLVALAAGVLVIIGGVLV